MAWVIDWEICANDKYTINNGNIKCVRAKRGVIAIIFCRYPIPLGLTRAIINGSFLNFHQKINTMERFLLIVREDLKMIGRMTEEERYVGMREMTKWVEEFVQAGNYQSGEPLFATGRYVGKDYVLSDGPFIEAKEGISGYMVFNAENIDQATSIAQSCPKLIRGELQLEIRPIMQVKNE
jgi:hypothetical protein